MVGNRELVPARHQRWSHGDAALEVDGRREPDDGSEHPTIPDPGFGQEFS